MLITMLTTGTRGDTQPYIALGLSLKKKGHRVRIVASEAFKDFVLGFGLEFAPTRGDITKIAASDMAKEARGADNPLKFFKSMKNDKLMEMFIDLQHDLDKACEGSDAIVYHPGASIAYFTAQRLNIPSILAAPFPMTPTSDFPALLFYQGPHLGKLYNKITHKIFEQGFWMMGSGPLKKYWASTYGKAPKNFGNPFKKQRTESHPTIVSLSKHVFAQPNDYPQNVSYNGYWFLDTDENYVPQKELADFLEAGDAPVYIGFGSMAEKETAKEMGRMVVEAVKKSGKRAIVATGWGSIEPPKDAPDNILFIEGAPHTWLFPKMSAIVHHGGAGTTAEALRSGVPSMVVPFGMDQFAWGKRVFELGVGAKSVTKKELTADKLAEGLKYMQQIEVKIKAKELGQKIRSDKGADVSADIILKSIKKYNAK